MMIWKEVLNAKLRYYPGICLEELKKITKTSQDSQCFSQILNQALPEYESRMYHCANPFSAEMKNV
jgi:hypothetical protein